MGAVWVLLRALIADSVCWISDRRPVIERTDVGAMELKQVGPNSAQSRGFLGPVKIITYTSIYINITYFVPWLIKYTNIYTKI